MARRFNGVCGIQSGLSTSVMVDLLGFKLFFFFLKRLAVYLS